MRPRAGGEGSHDERNPGAVGDAEGQDHTRVAGALEQLFGRQAPHLGRRYLEDRLAFRYQELAHGALSDRAHRKLNAAIDQVEPKAARRREPKRLLPGTELRRTWQNTEHRVLVREHDFEYDGRPYKSLSAIARAITSVRWNGPLFFGLRSGGTKR